MTAYLLDWCALLVRWLHIVAGIAWIGASFYFVWLDNHLQPPADAGRADAGGPDGAGGAHGGLGDNVRADTGVAGELWAVHGGGFYRSQKYRVAPPVLPQTLHWFYWEAYTTWLSGFALLCLLYFLRAEAYLIDPGVLSLTKPAAIAIGLTALIGSWLIYDGLCRSALGRHERALAGAVSLVIAAEAWGLTRIFSGRGAFMLFGSALGTIMVANVLFVIIPGQRELVRAKLAGRPVDPAPGLRGKQRSVHNTYFTLPVLFIMISNHYAMTYGGRYNWLVLIAVSFAGACIRAWFVARHRPALRGAYRAALPGVLGVLTLAGLVVALAPGRPVGPPEAGAGAGAGAAALGSLAAEAPVADPAQVQLIVQQRCAPCHAATPTQAGFSAAPNGIVLQTLEQVRAHLPEVRQQLAMRAMPLGNLTGMTEAERALVLMWIGHDASVSGAPPDAPAAGAPSVTQAST